MVILDDEWFEEGILRCKEASNKWLPTLLGVAFEPSMEKLSRS